MASALAPHRQASRHCGPGGAGTRILTPDAARGEEVERALRTALEIAEEQGAFLLKLRASTTRARLWRDQGKPQQARELLAPAYRWFTEGFDTR